MKLEGVSINNSKHSGHSQLRMAQRNLSESDHDYVLKHGTRLYRFGALFRFLRRKDIPMADRAKPEIARLEGTALVLDSKSGVHLTSWRNRESGFMWIKRKPKRRPPQRSG